MLSSNKLLGKGPKNVYQVVITLTAYNTYKCRDMVKDTAENLYQSVISFSFLAWNVSVIKYMT